MLLPNESSFSIDHYSRVCLNKIETLQIYTDNLFRFTG